MPQPESHRSFVPPAGWLEDLPAAETGAPLRFLLLATLLGGALRFLQLAEPSFWVDEMLTWQALRPDSNPGFWEQFTDTIQGPLHVAVLWPLVALRESEFMLRLPSAVAGLAAIPVFGLLAHRLSGAMAARLATLLFALSPFQIWYSQEGRGYAFLVLFSLLAVTVYLKMTERGPRWQSALAFGLLGAAAILSNMTGLFLLVALGAGLVLFHRPRSGRAWLLWTIAFGLALALALPWLLKASGIWAVDRIVPGGGTGEALRGETTFSWMALPYTLHTFFYGYSLGPSLRELHAVDRVSILVASLPLLVAGALPVLLGGAVGVVRGRPRRFAVLLWIVIPVVILILLAVRNVKPWNPRYAAMVSPFVLLLVCMGLVRLKKPIGVGLSVLLTCLTLWSLYGYYTDSRYVKEDIRQAAAIVTAGNAAGAPILVPVVTSSFAYYYSGPGEIIDTYGRPALDSAAAADAFCDSLLAGRQRCWVVASRMWFFDPEGFLPTALARRGHLRVADHAPGVEVYVWSREP